jgi:O-antigen/teichoic acid export membrane protein
LIFGTEYAPSVVALQILVWAPVFHFMNSPFARLFEALNRQMLVTKIWGFCLILSVILNLILIPKYSYIGASVTAALTGGLLLGLCFIWSAKIGYGIFNKKFAGIVTKVIIASVLMGVFIRYFYALNLLVLIPCSVVLYFVVLYVFGGIDKEDVSLMRRAVGK